MKPYLSIIIPYYNNKQALEQLISSIARSKTTLPYEIILVDDGSDAKLSGDYLELLAQKIQKNKNKNFCMLDRLICKVHFFRPLKYKKKPIIIYRLC